MKFAIGLLVSAEPDETEDMELVRSKLACCREEMEAATEQLLRRRFPKWSFEVIDSEEMEP